MVSWHGPCHWQHSVDARYGGLQIADAGQDNHWVVKPAQGARSMDLCLTDSEAMLVRMRGAPGGDRVVQKYIPQPVLYKDRKFDLRVLSYNPPKNVCPLLEIDCSLHDT